LLGKTDNEYAERLLDGKVLLSTRNGIFQVRLYKGNRQYIYKSLKTADLARARDLATRAYYELEFRKEQNLPVQQKRFGDVIDEYIQLRRSQFERGTYGDVNKANQQQTSEHMLRQMVRVSKFWREYCGTKAVDSIDDAVLRDYVPWRNNYYLRMPEKKRPRNSKLHPADKTLEWETTFALTLLKYAQERGYRGAKPLPKFRHKAQRTKTRPAFTLAEYTRLFKGIRRWMYEEKDNAKFRYTRELLRDYVLILANSGMRVGEANALRETDLVEFKDDTGRVLARNRAWADAWAQTAADGAKRHNRNTAKHGNWLFRMSDGNQIITLIDQFNEVLKRESLTHSTDNEKYTLYSLRHFYAVQMIARSNADVYAISRNMGTSVQMIEAYYGKHATTKVMATGLGG
jgi:integrase